MPASAASSARLLIGPERAGLERVGDRHSGEPEPLAQFSADDRG
jgi:hypothetical protein